MSGQLSFRSPRNNANERARSQPRSPLYYIGAPSQLSYFGYQAQQVFPFPASSTSQTQMTTTNGIVSQPNCLCNHATGFSSAPFDPGYNYYSADSTICIPREWNDLPAEILKAKLLCQITDKKSRLIAKQNELFRELQAVENGLLDLQYYEDSVLETEQMRHAEIFDHAKWTIERVEGLSSDVDFKNESLNSIKKKYGLKSFGDLRKFKSKEVLARLLKQASDGGLAENKEFVKNMEQMDEEDIFAPKFNIKTVYHSKNSNMESLVWCAAFYFFLDVKEEIFEKQLEDKCFLRVEGNGEDGKSKSPWIARSNAHQVAKGCGGQGVQAYDPYF